MQHSWRMQSQNMANLEKLNSSKILERVQGNFEIFYSVLLGHSSIYLKMHDFSQQLCVPCIFSFIIASSSRCGCLETSSFHRVWEFIQSLFQSGKREFLVQHTGCQWEVLTLAPASCTRIQVVGVKPIGSVHLSQQLPYVHHLNQNIVHNRTQTQGLNS